MLYSHNDSAILLGCLLNNPSLLLSEKYPIDKDDFIDNRFHRILFVCVQQLASQGAKEISAIDVMEFIKPYPIQYEVLQDNNAVEFIETVKKLSKADNIDVYYKIVRKMSLLRSYKNQGFDISEIYNVNGDEEQERRKLNGYEIDDIIKYFEAKILSIQKKFKQDAMVKEIQAGIGFESIKESFKTTPYFGACLQSPYQTTLYRGWCKGQLLLRSAPSGFGKTAIAVGDLCSVCANEYWDEQAQDFIPNANKQGNGLYINTELDLETELTPIFVAWISNVSRSNIMDGKYEGNEEYRVDRAIQILKESGIFLVDDPRFTLASLREEIREHIIQHQVESVVMDYIQDNGVISKEMAKTHAVVARDTIVLNMADTFKMWAKEFNLRFMSMTQLNGIEKINEIIDEACLAGGKAIKNKLDAGSIIMYPRKKELALTEMMAHKKGFGDNMKCNLVAHNYKIRFGKYGTNVKLFQHVDLGTGRIYDLYCTNLFDEPLKVEKTLPKKGE